MLESGVVLEITTRSATTITESTKDFNTSFIWDNPKRDSQAAGKNPQADKQAAHTTVGYNHTLVETHNPQTVGQADLSATFAEPEALPLLVVVQTFRLSCPFQSYVVSVFNQATILIR